MMMMTTTMTTFSEFELLSSVSHALCLCSLQTFREVELLASLSHPHVVRYYDNWLELKEAGLPVATGDTGE